jgi:hypothetical protein
VEQTQSLVSPYIGTLTFEVTREGLWKPKDEPNFRKYSSISRIKHDAVYAYQEGKWVLKARGYRHYNDLAQKFYEGENAHGSEHIDGSDKLSRILRRENAE